MDKEWYKEIIKEQVTKGNEIIGKNTRMEREKILDNMIKNSEEGYRKKRLRNRRKIFINKKGNIPKRKD